MDLCRAWEETTDWTACIDVQGQYMDSLEVCIYKASFCMLHIVVGGRQSSKYLR